MKKKAIWHMIAIKRPQARDKDTYRQVLEMLEFNCKYKHVALNEFEGSGTYGLFYHVREMVTTNKLFTFSEIYSILHHVDQFEWVDFFLFEKFTYDWSADEYSNYPLLMSKSDALVRGSDNGDIFIYSQTYNVIKTVKEHYLDSKLFYDQYDYLEDILVPY